MNLSALSIDALTQLETKLAGELEMVRRVKALVVEYQRGDGRSAEGTEGASMTTAVAVPAGGTSADSPDPAAAPQKRAEERLLQALPTMKPAGFILDDLWRATHTPHGRVAKDRIKSWVKSMVRKGKIRVVEVRAGRIGSIYAAVPPTASEAEG